MSISCDEARLLFNRYRNGVLSHNARVYIRDNDLWNGDPKPPGYEETQANEEGFMEGEERLVVPRTSYSNSNGLKDKHYPKLSKLHQLQFQKIMGFPCPSKMRASPTPVKSQTTISFPEGPSHFRTITVPTTSMVSQRVSKQKKGSPSGQI